MSSILRNTLRFTSSLLLYALLLNQTAHAIGAPQQDAGALASQMALQAAQQAQQAAQQAADQAMAAQQMAAQQAQQAAQAAADAAASSSSSAPQPPRPTLPTTPHGPIPTQIASAHTIFLTNAGAESNFPLDATRAYNDIYAALKSWGRYQLVDTSAQADLIFELHERARITDVSGYRGAVSSTTTPSFEIRIVDAKTQVALWTITSPIYSSSSKESPHWIALAEGNLISRVKVLTGQSLTATETADLTAFPAHSNTGLWIVGGVAAAAIIGGAIFAAHALSSMKQSQANFCTANNIPLSQCPGS